MDMEKQASYGSQMINEAIMQGLSPDQIDYESLGLDYQQFKSLYTNHSIFLQMLKMVLAKKSGGGEECQAIDIETIYRSVFARSSDEAQPQDD